MEMKQRELERQTFPYASFEVLTDFGQSGTSQYDPKVDMSALLLRENSAYLSKGRFHTFLHEL